MRGALSRGSPSASTRDAHRMRRSDVTSAMRQCVRHRHEASVLRDSATDGGSAEWHVNAAFSSTSSASDRRVESRTRWLSEADTADITPADWSPRRENRIRSVLRYRGAAHAPVRPGRAVGSPGPSPEQLPAVEVASRRPRTCLLPPTVVILMHDARTRAQVRGRRTGAAARPAGRRPVPGDAPAQDLCDRRHHPDPRHEGHAVSNPTPPAPASPVASSPPTSRTARSW